VFECERAVSFHVGTRSQTNGVAAALHPRPRPTANSQAAWCCLFLYRLIVEAQKVRAAVFNPRSKASRVTAWYSCVSFIEQSGAVFCPDRGR
jgi:hypothetical protein